MKIVIVGGGPAGMLAAISASKLHNDVTLIEKNEKLGKKLFITGKGRCNVTNNCGKEEFFKSIVHNSKFMNSSFNIFSNKDLKNLLIENGCNLKVERGNRVFPESDKSYDITDCFKRILKKQNVKVLLNTEVIDIVLDETENQIRSIIVKERESNQKERIDADRVIIATGGISYASTGSTGDGYKFAKKIGHNIVKQVPSLVPLNVKEIDDCRVLQDLTLKNVGIKIGKYTDFGEMIFTNFGVSGPIILSASSYINDFPICLSIDLKPALDYEKLDLRLIREIEENGNGKLKSILENLLPKKMVEIFMKRLSQSSDNLNINNADIDKNFRKKIVNLLKNFDFTIIGKRGFDEAIITSGGVDVKEINPKTMESKKVKGIYFAGEVIDVDCLTGGFNIQIAASTGYAAGNCL